MVERGAHGGAGGGVSGDGEAGQRRQNVAVTGQSLREHFHLPLHTVAQKLGMCTTAFKKMCRRLGISKWPHRQVTFSTSLICVDEGWKRPFGNEGLVAAVLRPLAHCSAPRLKLPRLTACTG